MATDQQIHDGIFKNARLEVAKKLKAAFPELNANLGGIASTPEDAEFLVLADEAIRTGKITLKGVGTLDIKDDIDPNVDELTRKKLGGTPSELIPTEPQLEQVVTVAQNSVKKATGPMTIKGVSFFTLITSFFEAIGDLLSGQGGGFAGFFDNLTKIAARRTGDAIGSNLESGLAELAGKDQAIAKWLTPKAIDQSVAAAKLQVKAIATGITLPDHDLEELAQVKSTEVYRRAVSATAQKDVETSVRTQLGNEIKRTMGADKPGSFLSGLTAMAGFSVTKQDATKITETVADAIADTVSNPEYQYKGTNDVLKKKLVIDKKQVSSLSPEELAMLLKEETVKALTTAKFGLDNNHIEAIAATIPAYVDKNYNELKNANEMVLGTAGTAPAPAPTKTRDPAAKPIVSIDADKAKTALEDGFEKKLRAGLADGLKKKKEDAPDLKDPFIDEAKKMFVEKGVQIIADPKNIGLLESGQEEALSNAIWTQMEADASFREKGIDKFKMLKPGFNKPSVDNSNVIITILGKGIVPQFKTFFEDKGIRDSLVTAKKESSPDVATTTLAPAAEPITPASDVATSPPPVGPTAAENEAMAKVIIGMVQSDVLSALQEGFAERTNKGAVNPKGILFNELTGLDKDSDAATNKPILLAQIADRIADSGIMSTPTNPQGMFVVDFASGSLQFKDPLTAESPAQAFKDAKTTIIASLEKQDFGSTKPGDKILLVNAIAERTAIGLFNKALPADKQLDPKAPEFTTAQVALAQKTIVVQIENGLKENGGLLNIVALKPGININRVADRAAQGLAPLAFAEEKDPEKINSAVNNALRDEIKDPGIRGQVANAIATGYAVKLGVIATAPAAAETASDKDKNLQQAKALARLTVEVQTGKAIQNFVEGVKSDIKSKPIWLAPEKFPYGTRSLARKVKPKADAMVNGAVDAAVDTLAGSVDQGKLSETIGKAVIAAAEADYSGKQFYQLDEQAKQKAIADQVRLALGNDKTFFAIFPGSVTVNPGSMVGFNLGVIKAEVPSSVKNRVVNTIAKNIENGFSSTRVSQPQNPPAIPDSLIPNAPPVPPAAVLTAR